jgi:hypothetical protein
MWKKRREKKKKDRKKDGFEGGASNAVKCTDNVQIGIFLLKI